MLIKAVGGTAGSENLLPQGFAINNLSRNAFQIRDSNETVARFNIDGVSRQLGDA